MAMTNYLGLNVRLLAGNPAAVTDWGPLLNAAVAGGARLLLFPAGEYPFATPLDFDDVNGLVLQGESGRMWYGSGGTSGNAAAQLVYQGAGPAAAVSARGTLGLTIRDLGVRYDNAGGSLTGPVLDLGQSTGNYQNWTLIENCTLGGKFSTSELFPRTALAAISLDNAVCVTVRDCSIGGAQWGILGARTDFSVMIRIRDCMFRGCSLAAFGNIHQRWTIDGCTFEQVAEDTGEAVIDSTGAGLLSTFSFRNCWTGDGETRFTQRRTNPWRAAFRDNDLYTTTGPLFRLQGGGVFSLTGNVIGCATSDQAIVDLGDVAGGDTAFGAVVIAGNDWVCTAPEAVLNRAGHRSLTIQPAAGAGAYGLLTVDGLRLGSPDRILRPTVTAGAALGTGGTVQLLDGSTDAAGQVVLTPGVGASAGVVCRLTFGNPHPSDRADPSNPLVLLSPFAGTNAVDAGLFVGAGYGSNLGFEIECKSAPAGNVWFNYLVLQR